LYVGKSCAGLALDELSKQGYERTEEDHSNTDWPRWRLSRSPLKAKMRDLEQNQEAAITFKADIEKTLERCTKDLARQVKRTKEKQHQVNYLQERNMLLESENEDLRQRQALLERELLKAE